MTWKGWNGKASLGQSMHRALGEPVPVRPPGPATEEKEKKEKGKGKGKVVQIATPPTTGRVARHRKRQTTVDAAKAGKPQEPAVPSRSILKRPETAEAEKKEQEKKREEEAARKGAEKAREKEAEKTAAMKRWEEGKLSQEEGETHSAAARPIRDLAGDAVAIEEVATGQRIAHMAGMRALGSRWEEEWACASQAPPQRQQQQSRQPPQQQQQQQQQQQSNWAQRAAAAAALP